MLVESIELVENGHIIAVRSIRHAVGGERESYATARDLLWIRDSKPIAGEWASRHCGKVE